MRHMAMALILVIGASALACGEKTTGGAADSGGGTGPRVAKFRIGQAVAPDGIVTLETDSFHQGDPVYVSFEVKNLPTKSPARVVWSGPGKKMISEEEKPISDKGAVSFQMKAAPDLEVGDYIVELFCGDTGAAPGKWTSLGTKGFRIGPKRPA